MDFSLLIVIEDNVVKGKKRRKPKLYMGLGPNRVLEKKRDKGYGGGADFCCFPPLLFSFLVGRRPSDA